MTTATATSNPKLPKLWGPIHGEPEPLPAAE
jgi:hypothetical protein